MPDEPMLTISLHAVDWQVILRGILELPMKEAAPTFNRLQVALAEAQKPPLSDPRVEKTIPDLQEAAQ